MDDPTTHSTFLFTDIQGSTRLWEEQPARMREALARHDALARDAVERHRGVVVKTTGDGPYALFPDALGRHHCRPEPVSQVVHPRLRRDFPALRSLEATPNNRP